MGSWLTPKKVALIITLLLVVAICGCVSVSPSSQIGNGSFIFLERYTNVTASIVNGTDPYPTPITGVLYSYNESARKLWLLFPQNLYDHYAGLKIFYGDTAMAYGHGDVDIGGHINYYLVSEFPFESNKVKITGIDENGAVRFSYSDQSITLKPGQSWSGDAYSTTENTQGRNGTVTLNLTRVDTFTNYGLLDVSSVTG